MLSLTPEHENNERTLREIIIIHPKEGVKQSQEGQLDGQRARERPASSLVVLYSASADGTISLRAKETRKRLENGNEI